MLTDKFDYNFIIMFSETAGIDKGDNFKFIDDELKY